MRNPAVPEIAKTLRNVGYEVFDDWYSPGANTDEEWQRYERQRGRSFLEAMKGYHAKHVFEFDKAHLDRASAVILALPAGKSAHLELGYVIGQGKPGFICMPGEPERYDIMYGFATGIYTNMEDLVRGLEEHDVR